MPRTVESVAPARPVAYGQFIGEERKAALSGSPLAVISARFDADHRYDGRPQPRWLLDVVELASGELLCPTFGSNPARDGFLGAVAKLIDDNPDGEAPGSIVAPIVMELVEPRKGLPFWGFRTATDDELANANLDLADGQTIEAAVASRVAGALEDAMEDREAGPNRIAPDRADPDHLPMDELPF